MLFGRLPFDLLAQVAQELFSLLARLLQPLGFDRGHPARTSWRTSLVKYVPKSLRYMNILFVDTQC